MPPVNQRVEKTALRFLFVVCQRGAESTLKSEIGASWPQFRFSYSRPGFVTFKVPSELPLVENFDLRSVFARTYGFSIGKVRGERDENMASQIWEIVHRSPIDHVHVWERDRAVPGENGFEPGVSEVAQQFGRLIVQNRPKEQPAPMLNHIAKVDEFVLDCIQTTSNEWWIGFHKAASFPSRWPGGVFPQRTPEDMISRAYLKMKEALTWSRMPIQTGDLCAEIGSSPGGSCQALLETGLNVWGIDPAKMDPRLLAQPRFTHIRKRAADMKRREFRDVKWLIADSNVAPNHTLDSVEAIVKHRSCNVRGLLLTIKLLQWNLAEHAADYVQRIRSWGYEYVRARQLAYNRREFCIAAFHSRSMRKESTNQTAPPRL